MSLSDLFTEGDYRFHLGLRKGSPEEFFRASDPGLKARRREWLDRDGSLYSGLLPEGEPLLEECLDIGVAWQTLSPGERAECEGMPAAGGRCALLGKQWEPDFLLVRGQGNFPLLGACVVFPSSWSLEGKLGRGLAEIHAPVPGLNAAAGRGIEAVLGRLKPGGALFRHNWGLSRSPELNQHPSRNLPRLDAAVSLPEVWLRVEHQALILLPRTGGILFGIRITMHPLTEVREDPEAAARLTRALRSMPEDLAVYKGLAGARPRLIEVLS